MRRRIHTYLRAHALSGIHICVIVYMFASMCVRVCVCVRARARVWQMIELVRTNSMPYLVYLCAYVYMCTCLYAQVCVCVCLSERERERDSMCLCLCGVCRCVCVCVCIRSVFVRARSCNPPPHIGRAAIRVHIIHT